MPDWIGRFLGSTHTLPAPPVVKAAPSNGNGSETKALRLSSFAYSHFWPLDANGNTFPAQPEGLEAYRSAWLIYALTRFRATKLVEPALWIFEEQDGQEVPIEGAHELAAVLEQPNPDMDMSELLFATSALLDSTGEALWVKNRDKAGRLFSLYPFGADQFSVEGDGERLYATFKVQTATGPVEYSADDVVYFREFESVAPLHAAAARIGLDAELLKSMQAGIRNAVVPGATMSFPDHVTPEQVDEFKEGVAAQYSAARNHGKLFVTGGGATLTRNALGFTGLEAGEIGREIEAAVCACYQVHPAVIGAYVGLKTGQDKHNAENAVRQFYDNAMLPRWAWMEKIITRSLLREVDDNPLRFIRFDKSTVAALQEDLTEKVEIADKARGFLTINERRGLLGFPPIEGPEGDQLTIAPAAPDPLQEAERDAPEEDSEPKALPAPETKASRQALWALADAVARTQESMLQLVVSGQLTKDRAAIYDILTGPKAEVGKLTPEDARRLIEDTQKHLKGAALEDWNATVLPWLESIARQSVQRVAGQMGISFELLQPQLARWVEKEGLFLSKAVTDTTLDAVKIALRDALDAGEGIEWLTARLEDTGAFDASRAQLIARTETTRAVNGAQRESLSTYQRQAGRKIVKTWLSAQDERVRDEHAEMDGEQRAVDEVFSNGRMQPDEPNCRCTLIYSAVSER